MLAVPRFVLYSGIALAGLGISTVGTPLAVADEIGPNCTAADLLGVTSGVAASESVYLHTHPDVNEFFNSLNGKSTKEIRSAIDNYMSSNPDVRSDLEGIRQPVTDFKERCQISIGPAVN
ncbi:heme-binding protein [Mycobacteroides franklinii]|uniref:heme-binding protein n=1 Tax=Mycobacteroides franklinii TaxID=948102 RepID=UPI0009941387|nr:heme-binding protein [Mycobacteroides franklinii]